MSEPLGYNISICDREFSNYSDLAKHMRLIVTTYVTGTDEISQQQLTKELEAFKKSIIYGENYGVYSYLVKENFPIACIDLMKLCMKKDEVTLLRALLSCIITITDNSEELTIMLLKLQLAELLIDQTVRIFKSDFKSHLPEPLTVEDLYDQIILIVVNIICDVRFQEQFKQTENITKFKDLIIPFMKSKDGRRSIMTMSALTYLIDEEEDKDRLDFYYKIIDNFVEYITRATSNKDRRCEGLRSSEMLKVLQSLSKIESIKNNIIRMNSLIPLLSRILESQSATNGETKVALGILYNLSFKDVEEKESKNDDPKSPDICNITIYVQPFLKNSEIQRIAKGVMSELGNKFDNIKFDILYDIFISYSHYDETKMLKVSNILKSKGFKVSLLKDIRGSENEDSVLSIKQSKMCIIGVSNSYYNDPFCHTACLHAYDSKKPIIPLMVEPQFRAQDWLGKIIRSEERLDFTNESDFDNIFEKLLTLIKQRLSCPEMTDIVMLKENFKLKDLSVTKPTKPDKEIKDWSKEEVADWLRANNLSRLGTIQGIYNGTMLEYLRNMKTQTPGEYSRRLKDDLKLSFEDEIDFDSAIGKLNI